MAKYYDIDTPVRINGSLVVNGDISIPTANNIAVSNMISANNIAAGTISGGVIIGDGSGITSLSSSAMPDVLKLDGSRAMTGDLKFNIASVNSATKGIVWSGLTDTHSIYVEEYGGAESTRLVICNKDNGDSDYTLFRNESPSGSPKDVFEIRRSYVKSLVDFHVTGNIIISGTVDGVDISSFKSAFDSHNHDSQYLGINAKAVDSDKLDGYDSSYFTRRASAEGSVYSMDTRSTNYAPQDRSAGLYVDFKQNTTDGLSDGGTYHGVLTFRPYGSGTDFSGGSAHQIGFTENGNLFIRKGTGASWGSWSKIWHAGNDGAGSGLDADLLDGLDSSKFVRNDVAGQNVSGNFTILGDGNLWVGSSSNDNQDGEIVIRDKTGINRIHFDGGSDGKVDSNVNVYITGSGNASFSGKMDAYQVESKAPQGTAPFIIYSDTLVSKLNAEKINGVTEPELAKNQSIYEIAGSGVYEGLKVVQQPTPNMSVLVQAGTAYTASGRRFTYNNTTVTIDAAHPTYERRDIIYIDGGSEGTEGQIKKKVGTPAASPADPAVPADAIVLARVKVRANDGSITDGTGGTDAQIDDIREWRPVIYDRTNDVLNINKANITTITNTINFQKPIKNTAGATSIVFNPGETSKVWNHNLGVTNYVVRLSCDSFEPHIRWTSKQANSITIELDDVCETAVTVDVSIELY